MTVWLVVEQDEDEGTDWYTVHSVWASKEAAAKEVERLSLEHGWSVADSQYVTESGEDFDDWCWCHRKDWAVEGPWEVLDAPRE